MDTFLTDALHMFFLIMGGFGLIAPRSVIMNGQEFIQVGFVAFIQTAGGLLA